MSFLARGADSTVLLTSHAATFTGPGHPVTMRLFRSADVNPVPTGRFAGLANYFLGNDPAAWRSGVATTTAVAYPNAWPGVRMAFRGSVEGIEYRFRVAPGADPSSIGLSFTRGATARVEASGALVVRTPGGRIMRHGAPTLFQRSPAGQVRVEGRFLVKESGRVGFAVGGYDPGLPLVIDPVINVSTFFGGSGDDIGWAEALGSGSTFTAGETRSVDFPFKAGAMDTTLGGSCDAFLLQMNVHKQTPVVNATYFGGGGCDRALGLAVTSTGIVYMAGVTDSADLPTTPGAYRTLPYGGPHDGWVAQISSGGSSLTYSTYLGGTGDDGIEDLALDAGIAYVTGTTTSADFPTTLGAAPAGGSEAFATAFDPTGSGLAYSRVLGGSADDASGGIAVAPGGAATVTGWTDSPAFPTTAGVLQASKAAGRDAFLTELTSSGALSYSTFLGGWGTDRGASVAVRAGVAYVGGDTTSGNFPTTPGAYRERPPGGALDAFAIAVNPGGTSAKWSTYLGGSGIDSVGGVTADKRNNAYIVGSTTSADMPQSGNRFQDGLAGGTDGFLVMLRSTGATATIATYIGGSSEDAAHDVAVESMGEPVLTGQTASADFPTAQRPAQPSIGGALDVFLASISTAKPTRTTLTDAGFGTASISAILDTNVQWDMPSSNTAAHSVSDADGIGLFGSGALRPPGSRYAVRFLAAGTYTILDDATADTSSVAIPDVAKPRNGTQATTFTVTWCAGQVPDWLVFDVQIQRPGFATWSDLVGPGVTSVSKKFIPDSGIGTYSFRSRVRNKVSGNFTGWSPVVSVTVG